MSEQTKVALVTGASRGIGKAITQHLCAGGYTVVGTATTESGADKITAYLQEAGNLYSNDWSTVRSAFPGTGERLSVPVEKRNGAAYYRLLVEKP